MIEKGQPWRIVPPPSRLAPTGKGRDRSHFAARTLSQSIQMITRLHAFAYRTIQSGRDVFSIRPPDTRITSEVIRMPANPTPTQLIAP